LSDKPKARNECRDKKNNASTLYTGSLIMSYIQFHLTPRWNPLKPVAINYNTQQFLNPTRTIQPKLKNSISVHLALQETLSKSD